MRSAGWSDVLRGVGAAIVARSRVGARLPHLTANDIANSRSGDTRCARGRGGRWFDFGGGRCPIQRPRRKAHHRPLHRLQTVKQGGTA